jgi:hypothetical protein
MPGVGDHYMAATGRDSQLTDIPIRPDRPDDLEHPVDDDHDVGARGIFDDQTGGMLRGDFIVTLPKVALDAARAAGGRMREVAAQRR